MAAKKAAPKKTAIKPPATSAKPKFGSPAWDAKYGIKTKKAKGK